MDEKAFDKWYREKSDSGFMGNAWGWAHDAWQAAIAQDREERGEDIPVQCDNCNVITMVHGYLPDPLAAKLDLNKALRNQALRIQHRLKEFYELVPLSPDRKILFPVSIQAILSMVQEFIDGKEESDAR